MKAYRMRIYPSKEQVSALHKIMYQARMTYNDAVIERQRAHRNGEKRPSHYGQRDRLCKERNANPNERAAVPAKTVDILMRKLDASVKGAYTRMKKGQPPRFPKPIKRTYSVDFRKGSFTYHRADGTRFGRLRVQNVPGLIKLREHREIPKDKIKEVSVMITKTGEWYASLVCDVPCEIACVAQEPRAVGLDFGLKTRIATSDGTKDTFFHPPVSIDDYKERQVKLARAVSRKFKPGKKQSKRYYNAKRAKARLEEKIARCRGDWQHNVTTMLARDNAVVFAEDIQPTFLLSKDSEKKKNKGFRRHAADAAIGRIKQLLTYKCGKRLRLVDAAYTTQRCSRCGAIAAKELSEREHNCKQCGLALDRDTNAARNVLQAGLAGLLVEPFVKEK